MLGLGLSELIIIIVLHLAVACFVAFKARTKGHGWLWWFLIALALSIFALPMVLFLKPGEETLSVACPRCGTQVPGDVTTCPDCRLLLLKAHHTNKKRGSD